MTVSFFSPSSPAATIRSISRFREGFRTGLERVQNTFKVQGFTSSEGSVRLEMRAVTSRRALVLIFLLAAAGDVLSQSGSFAQWEKDVAAFEAADRTTPPPKNALLFVGSSTIVRWTTLEKDF